MTAKLRIAEQQLRSAKARTNLELISAETKSKQRVVDVQKALFEIFKAQFEVAHEAAVAEQSQASEAERKARAGGIQAALKSRSLPIY